MSRIKTMFTREFTSTVVSAMVCDIETASVKTETFTIPLDMGSDKVKALMYLQKNVQTAKSPIVSVVSMETKKELRGCYIEDFLKISFPLDENRKPIED